MSYRYHGRASVDPNKPKAFGICDRCGFLFNLRNLRWQFDFAGPVLQNLRILVCHTCYDKPQEQHKPVLLPPDPLPVPNARPQNYEDATVNHLNTQNLDKIATEDDELIVTPQTSENYFE
jgi:hypothetical protein